MDSNLTEFVDDPNDEAAAARFVLRVMQQENDNWSALQIAYYTNGRITCERAANVLERLTDDGFVELVGRPGTSAYRLTALGTESSVCDFCEKEPCDCDWHKSDTIPDLDLDVE